MLRACKCRWARAHAQRPTGKTSSSALSPQASPEGMPERCNATYNPDEGVCVARDSLHPPMTFPVPLPLMQLTPPGPWFISEAILVLSALHQFPLLHSSHCSECSPVRLPRAASPLVRILSAEALTRILATLSTIPNPTPPNPPMQAQSTLNPYPNLTEHLTPCKTSPHAHTPRSPPSPSTSVPHPISQKSSP